MYLERLALTHFRNISKTDEIVFHPNGLHIAAAPNATGKTNFLESIYVLLRGRSWRASLAQCVQWRAPGFLLEGVAALKDERPQLKVRYAGAPYKLFIEENNSPASVVTFLASYPLILFLPEDTFVFVRGPEQRRNFMNHILLSVPSYVATLVHYQRILQQRNAALKQASSFAAVAPWTPLLSYWAASLWQYRAAFIQFLENAISPVYEELSGEARTFKVHLVKGSGADEVEAFQQLLEDSFLEEQRYGYTLYGPHRDDIVVTTDDRPIQSVLSRGQLRGLILAMKVAASAFLRQTVGQQPLLLLDDVFSELDEDRQTALLSHLPSEAQIIVTCTHVPPGVARADHVRLLDLRAIVAPSAYATAAAYV